MKAHDPVYTEKAECQDCFKCVRRCPVKAIRVQEGRAVVVPELCIACGRCVLTCPVGAKRIRQDVEVVRSLLQGNAPVYLSLAPSYAAEFEGVHPGRLVAALRKLGFAGVSETALGAEQVSAAVRTQCTAGGKPGVVISSACPAAVELLAKHHPHLTHWITPMTSPLLAHCRLLKQHFGADAQIVFAGPCAGKKREADEHPDLLAAALTFRHLREWLAEEGLLQDLDNLPEEPFVPCAARGGVLYPVDGGMIAGIRRLQPGLDTGFMSLAGIEAILEGLEGIEKADLQQPLFLEVLACEGGCINGPGISVKGQTVAKRLRVLQAARTLELPAAPEVATELPLTAMAAVRAPVDEAALREALQRVGKLHRTDELNCGGCGYESCRDFAAALVAGYAEPAMCVSFMRKRAQNKASALMQAMPSGVVIVDDRLRIVECNRAFAELLGAEALLAYEACPGLEGVGLEKMRVPELPFRQMLESGDPGLERDLRLAGRLLHVSLYTIEPQRLVGAILADVTAPAVQRAQVIRKTREVIRKNLTTVQQIACLLGENAAESEMILGSIIDAYSADGPLEDKTDA